MRLLPPIKDNLPCGYLAVILVAKGDLFFIYQQQAVAGDGHLVGIAAQVLNHLLGSHERTFGVHHPRR